MTACVRTGNIVPKGGNTVDDFFVFSLDPACFRGLMRASCSKSSAKLLLALARHQQNALGLIRPDCKVACCEMVNVLAQAALFQQPADLKDACRSEVGGWPHSGIHCGAVI